MCKEFNINGDCKPDIHYMVDISKQLNQIKAMIDSGKYFTINRARQYGKTTTLNSLEDYLKDEYVVINLDFQFLSRASFETEQKFAAAFSKELLKYSSCLPDETAVHLKELGKNTAEGCTLQDLFLVLSAWCRISEKKIVLMIDEVDSAANNQVFLDFLSQLRGCYLRRNKMPVFQSVILAGVYDVKNIKMKLRSDDEHKTNSPWNIAADFDVEMSFSRTGIAGMLLDYEADHLTRMNINKIAGMIYDYTSGYPYLVSRICKLIDERLAGSRDFPTREEAWTKRGLEKAVTILLSEKNTLFESLEGKLNDYPQLKKTLYSLLIGGRTIVYNVYDEAVNMAIMFGFVKKLDGNVIVANRIFETSLYNYFLTSPEAQRSPLFLAASEERSQFIENGHLNMDIVLKKFVEHFDDIYGDQKTEFSEEEGRRYFLLYIRPIINGIGNYYVEAQTRNARRMDVVIDYLGERFIIELKVWHGNSYNERGEKQLSDYLDYFHLKKGYMLSFNFNIKKEIGVKEIHIGDRLLVEAVV